MYHAQTSYRSYIIYFIRRTHEKGNVETPSRRNPELGEPRFGEFEETGVFLLLRDARVADAVYFTAALLLSGSPHIP